MKGRQKLRLVRILIIEAHPVVREGLFSLLNESPQISVVGQVATGEDGVVSARELRPDVLIIDTELPGMDGLDVAETVRRELPELRVILLSARRNAQHLERAMRAGVHAYLLKNAPLEHVVHTVLTVRSPGNDGLADISSGPGSLRELSDLERKILVHVANGMTNKQIGQLLSIKERRLRSYRELIMRKLNVKSTVGLTRFAVAHGLISSATA